MTTDSHHRWIAAGLILAVAAVSTPASPQERAVVLLAQGGYQIPLGSLSDQGDELRSGWTFGGGLGLQFAEHFALRGTVLFNESGYRGLGLPWAQPGFRRIFASLDLQTGLPSAGGWAPYAFAGAGMAWIDPRDNAAAGFTSFAARFGMGTNYVLENRFLTLLLELGGVVYDFTAYGFSGYQFDMQVLAGVAYAITY